MTRLVQASGDNEQRLLDAGRPLLQGLVKHDDWLPDAFAEADAGAYRQNLLYCDPLERFSVVSFVWGPGQISPVHDHTVWGMIGVLRGAELCEEFAWNEAAGELEPAGQHRMEVGDVDLVSPTIGDIHRVSNALAEHPSVSIHVSGANIGEVSRRIYALPAGTTSRFVSGYSNSLVPNLWIH